MNTGKTIQSTAIKSALKDIYPNIVLSQCSTIKRNLKISQKNIWKKTRLLNKYRSILSTRLNPHDFALIERSINETFAIIERRYNSAEFSYDSASTSYEN